MAKIRVKVIEKDGEFVVDPPIAILSFNAKPDQNDCLKIFNTTREDLIFRIESAVPFGAQSRLEVVRSGESTMRTVDEAAVEGQDPTRS